MIKVLFTQSPDTLVLHEFYFPLNIISFGTALDNNLVINDSALTSKALRLEATKDGLICSNVNIPYFHSNGKKISGSKLHKKDDLVVIGKTSFKIIDYLFDATYLNNIQKAYIETIRAHPDAKEVLKEIKQEIKDLG